MNLRKKVKLAYKNAIRSESKPIMLPNKNVAKDMLNNKFITPLIGIHTTLTM